MYEYERKQSPGGIVYIQERPTGNQYGEVLGGIAWGTEKRRPFIYVVGVSAFKEPILNQHTFHVLAEHEARDLNDLFIKSLEFKHHFCIRDLYGDVSQDVMMNALYEFDNRRERDNQVEPLSPAPNSELPNAKIIYLDLIRRLTNPRCRRLDFLKIPAFQVSSEAMEFPSMMALGYALSVLDTWEPKEASKRNPSKCDTFFEIFREEKRKPDDPYEGEPVGGSGIYFPVF